MATTYEKKIYKAAIQREYPKTVITVHSSDPLVELLIKTNIIYGVKYVEERGVTYLSLDNFEIENKKPLDVSSHGIHFEMDEFWNSHAFHYKEVLSLLEEFYDDLDEDSSNLKALLDDPKYSRLHYTISKFTRQLGEANRFNEKDYKERTGSDLRRPRPVKSDKKPSGDRKPKTDKPANNKGREKLRRD